MYKLYEDIELFDLYMKSKKEKKYYLTLMMMKSEKFENLIPPKYIIIKQLNIKGQNVKIINLLNSLKTKEQYETLVREVRNLYYTEIIKLVKLININNWYRKENNAWNKKNICIQT